MEQMWRRVRLKDISEVNPRLPNYDNIDDDLEVQFLPMRLVEELTGKIHLTETKKHREVKKGYTPFMNGDVIFAKVTPCMENGKIAVVDNLKNGVGYGSSEFHVIRSKGNLLSKYAFYYLVQQKFRTGAENEMTGAVGLRRVPKQFLENTTLPLPSVEEQTRVVSKIEELFSELDKSIEQLKTAQRQLKVYRQSVLKRAFEGKLTNENANDDELPKDWKITNLGQVLSFVGSGVTPKGGKEVYRTNGVIFIRSQNVYPIKLVLEDVAFISDEIDERMKRTRVRPKDVLLNITGASIGRCAFVPEVFPKANVNQHVCILRPADFISSEFLSYYLNSPLAQDEIMNTQGGATRQGLNFKQIRNMSLPFCPLTEQHKVVQEIESRLSIADKLEETITNSLQQAEALRQSILKKAFEGNLA